MLIHHEFDYIYDGKWKQGKMHGFGKLRKGTKMTFYYEGYFKDNEFDGKVSSNSLHYTLCQPQSEYDLGFLR